MAIMPIGCLRGCVPRYVKRSPQNVEKLESSLLPSSISRSKALATELRVEQGSESEMRK